MSNFFASGHFGADHFNSNHLSPDGSVDPNAMRATISGSSSVQAAIVAKGNMSASLSGSGTCTGTLSVPAEPENDLVASIGGSGSITATLTSIDNRPASGSTGGTLPPARGKIVILNDNPRSYDFEKEKILKKKKKKKQQEQELIALLASAAILEL